MSRVSTLILVIGLLCLFFGVVGFLWALAQPAHVEKRFLPVAGWYAASGASLLLLRALVFVLPAKIRRRVAAAAGPAAAAGLPDERRPAAPSGGALASPPPAQRGSALVLVLVLVGLVGGMVLQSQVRSRMALQQGRRMSSRVELERAAADAARAALQRLADDEDLRVDSTNDAWAVAEDLAGPLGIATLVKVADANRYFDLNNVSARFAPGLRPPDDILGDILMQCGHFAASVPVNALVDWTDPDDRGLRESDFYGRRDPPHKASNRQLFDWQEVTWIDGWSREMFLPRKSKAAPGDFDGVLADCVAVIPVSRTQPVPVNINTASRQVLLGVVGVENEGIVSSILTLRALRPIRSLDALSVLADPLLFTRIGGYLDVRSQFFLIRASAYREGESLLLDALAQRQPSGQVRVLRWTFL